MNQPNTHQMLIARPAELAAIRELIAKPAERPRAVVLTGEAGIGKSTVWSAGVELAREAGWRVLAARGDQTETGLSFAGLTDLLDPVAGEVLDRLPAAQRVALEVAMVRRLPDGSQLGPHEVGTATAAALCELCHDRPVLLAIDDLPWIDRATITAFEYALSRLAHERLRLLATRRTASTPASAPPETPGLLPPDDAREVPVTAIDSTAAATLLADRLDVRLPVTVLRDLVEHSGGNPFWILEFGAALRRGDRTHDRRLDRDYDDRTDRTHDQDRRRDRGPNPDLDHDGDRDRNHHLDLDRGLDRGYDRERDPDRDRHHPAPAPAPIALPIPTTLTDLVRERLTSLPPQARQALVVTAALPRPNVALVVRALAGQAADPAAAVAQAVAGGVLTLTESQRLRPAHPLLGAAALDALLPLARAALHRRLAELVEDPEQRARHVMLAAGEPPEAATADQLMQGAVAARGRGAVSSAVELAELAIRFTPAGSVGDLTQRQVAAAELHYMREDVERARELAAAAWAARAAAPPVRRRHRRTRRAHLLPCPAGHHGRRPRRRRDHPARRAGAAAADRAGPRHHGHPAGYHRPAARRHRAGDRPVDGVLKQAQELHVNEPAARGRPEGDLAQALVTAGRLAEAAAVAAELADIGSRLDRPTLSGITLRVQGLIAAARGELDEAVSLLTGAAEADAASPMPVERGRSLLALGQVQRRRKAKTEARRALQEALDCFTEHGHRPFAQLAEAELARGRRAGAGSVLTASEQRVADLVAAGYTNREVAARLSMSVRTVETHVGSVFRKLGVRSRSELAGRFPTMTP